MPQESQRSAKGIVALYDFKDGGGATVKDRSGAGLDLKIEKPGAVNRSEGKLQLTGTTRIRAIGSSKTLIRKIKRTRELTIEAWVQSAKTKQSGPARIVTLSKNANERNFTLGQDGNRFDVRLRTTKNSTNGLPSVASLPGSLKSKLAHVVYARNRGGKVRIWLNGKQNFEAEAAGDLTNWDEAATLGLGNEMTGDRPWLGTYHLVAIYNRALSARDIVRNFKAGPGGTTAVQSIAQR